MQFFVQRTAQMQVGQWYFMELVLKKTRSVAVEIWTDRDRIKAADKMAAPMACGKENERLAV
jgi:hypothetical protein